MANSGMSVDKDIGRLEGKMDLMLNNQIKAEDKVVRLHERVDRIEVRQKDSEVEQAKTRRDMKWAVVIVMGIASIGKWLLAKLALVWGK